MSDFLRQILSLSLGGSILACLLMFLRPLLLHRTSKAFWHAAWLIVLLRLLLPISLPGVSLNHGIPTLAPDPNLAPFLPSNPYPSDSDELSRTGQNWHGSSYLFILWLGGAVTVLTMNLVPYLRFQKGLTQRSWPGNLMEQEIIKLLGSSIPIYRCPDISTPLLVGLLRPRIYLPDYPFTAQQLEYILKHELAHHQRRDLAGKWLTLAAVTAHWFNPMVYLVRRELDRASELACDESLIKGFSFLERQLYGNTLLCLAGAKLQSVGAISVALRGQNHRLKERLVAIMNPVTKSRRAMLISLALVIAVLAGALLLGGGGTQAYSPMPDYPITTADLGNSFAQLAEREISHIPYLKLGAKITLTLPGDLPDEVRLFDHVLSRDGNVRYTHREIVERPVTIEKASISFVVSGHWATHLSSNSDDYRPGKSYRGFRLAFRYGEQWEEHYFLFRSDAGLTENGE